MGIGLRNKGYRFRVYLFAGLIVLLVLTSFTFALGVVWYSKHTTALIIEKDFRAREIERSVVDLLLSMERNRKKYVLLGKPEYKAHFDEDSERFRHERLGCPIKKKKHGKSCKRVLRSTYKMIHLWLPKTLLLTKAYPTLP
jgi:hypothetical protein